jgi:3-oxoacyl-[acyl-carrier protein] reductase
MISETMNNTVLITGGSGGLGKAIVSAFCKSGFRVVLNYLSSDLVVKEIVQTFGSQIIPLKADVGRYSDVSKIAGIIAENVGRINVIINNAGITRDALLIKQTEAEWDIVLKTNLKGVFNTIRAFAPLMKDGGHIINISSFSGIKGREGQTAYSASKSALIGLTKSAAAELAQYNIRVNAIVPGYMPVGLGKQTKVAMENAIRESLLNCLSEPEEVSNFIIYLIGTKNITGQIFCLESRIVW